MCSRFGTQSRVCGELAVYWQVCENNSQLCHPFGAGETHLCSFTRRFLDFCLDDTAHLKNSNMFLQQRNSHETKSNCYCQCYTSVAFFSSWFKIWSATEQKIVILHFNCVQFHPYIFSREFLRFECVKCASYSYFVWNVYCGVHFALEAKLIKIYLNRLYWYQHFYRPSTTTAKNTVNINV